MGDPTLELLLWVLDQEGIRNAAELVASAEKIGGLTPIEVSELQKGAAGTLLFLHTLRDLRDSYDISVS